MAKVKESFDLGKITDPAQFMRFASTLLKSIGLQFNGGLELGENIRASVVDVNFSTAATDVAVKHSLGRVPIGYLIASSSAAANIYDGAGKNTDSTIYIRASVPVSAKVVVI